jgi:hypothetical protein
VDDESPFQVGTRFEGRLAVIEFTGLFQPDSTETRSFRTHASYVRAFRVLALGDDNRMTSEDRLAQLHDVSATALASARRVNDVDEGELFACLRRAWAAELILAATQELGEESDMMRLANSWGTVQAYYVLYGATQAVLVAEGQARPKAHESTRRQFVNLWVGRSFSLPPWTLAAGDPGAKGADQDGFLGGPGRIFDLSLHAWSSWMADQAWDIAAAALKSTRKARVDERCNEARDRKLLDRKKTWKVAQDEREAQGKVRQAEPEWRRPNLKADERQGISAGVRPITLADYLYRLRIKANYEDATVFTEGPESDRDANDVALDLVHITSANLLVHELRVAKRIGKDRLVSAMDVWLKRHGDSLKTYQMKQRRELHATMG